MFTALDQIANRRHLQLVKAALPYVPLPGQKQLSVFIKLLELQNVLQFYQSGEAAVSACSAAEPPGMLEMLNGMRGYCEGEEQALLDQWISTFSMLELYASFAQMQRMEEEYAAPDDSGEIQEQREEAPYEQ